MLNPIIKLLQRPTPSAKKMDKALTSLTSRAVLVGVPESTSPRNSGAAQMNNATLAYIHDNGSPLANIPQREFLRPGVRDDKANTIKFLGQGARLALDGNTGAVERALTSAGLSAQKSIRRKISTGPFAPLKPSTVRGRIRRHKGRTGVSAQPLIDTGQLRQSINFVVVDKK
jgi:hypothetical protein